MRKRLASQEGWAVVVAVSVLTVMLGVGIGTFAFVQGQQKQSGDERVRESAFNLAEGALSSAANYLSVQGKYPSATSPYPTCTQASTTNCPDAATVSAGFTNADYRGTPTWTTVVHDNGAPNSRFYVEAQTGSQPAYDANGDGAIWMKAEATVQGKKRSVVGLVKSEPVIENFPKTVLMAGKMSTTNSGKKAIIDTQGGSATASKITVRCTTSTSPTRSNTCLGFDSNKGQVNPPAWETGATSGVACPDGSFKCAMDDAGVDRLKSRAIAAGTYYSGCPAPNTKLAGAMVFVESGNCSIGSNTVINSKNAPGMLVIKNGTFTASGGAIYYGVVYMPNRTKLTGDVVTISGNAKIVGGVLVDYDGGVSVGSSGPNLVYDANAFNNIASNGTVSIVAGTFRELPR